MSWSSPVYMLVYCHIIILHEMRMHTKLQLGNQEGKDHLGDLGINGRII
jgi:hypothetical protein